MRLIRIEFDDKASIQHLTNLRDWSEKWWTISRGIAMACKGSPEDFRVVGAKRGSFVLELAVALVMTKLIASILREVMSVAKEGLELAKLYQEVRERKFSADTLENLKSDLESFEKNRLEELLGKAVAAAPGKVAGDAKNALRKSIRELIKFYKAGGTVDYSIPQLEQEEDDTEEGAAERAKQAEQIDALRAEVAEIRELTQEVGRLEHLDPGDDPAEDDGSHKNPDPAE